MSTACAHTWKADALETGALGASDAASFERHARTCKECRDRVRIDRRLRSLVDQLPTAEPGDLQIHRLRARMLSHARERATHTRPPWTRAWLVGAVPLVAVLLAIAFLAGRRGSLPLRDEAFASSVTATPGTHWSQTRGAKVETLLLTHGELWIVVRKQAPDERFLVETPDGELEVRGTTFDVLVDGHSTRHVHVVEGLVALRLRDHPALELAAGQTWDLDTPEATSTPKPATPLPTPPPTAVAAAPPPSGHDLHPVATSHPKTESTDYEAAMELYRVAHYAEAAEAFRRFAEHHRNSGLTEDATFLEALSLTKAGHADAGSVAASRHLAEFPNSFHRKEASVLVARAARDRGDCEEARRIIAPWVGSEADATIREAMGACAKP